MTYCEEGDKPKVKYRSKSKGERVFYSTKSPIEVELGRVKKNSLGEDYNAQGYTIVSADGSETQVINHRTRIQNGQTQIQFWSCGNTDWDNRQSDGSYSVWYPLTSPIVSVDKSRGCPPPIPPQDYSIKVLHNGQLIFSDRSDTEISYEVICGNCPSGQCETKTARYPGYCCVDCKTVANQLNNLIPKTRCCNG